eukprot:TRINITY_DN12670_c0_g1_i4.p1 TRINITY_DN12670_c0_g1~~TRINITY_DN12670_c0_g1_i4.p1  ORF type:complete len:745 (+),score=230.71 TRINITY_DN12670_c0_g1_i4:214-2448(+)
MIMRTLMSLALVALLVGASSSLTLNELQGTWTGELRTTAYVYADKTTLEQRCLSEPITLISNLLVRGSLAFLCRTGFTTTLDNGEEYVLEPYCFSMSISSIDGDYIHSTNEWGDTFCWLLSDVTSSTFVHTVPFERVGFDYVNDVCLDASLAGSIACAFENTTETHESYYWRKISSDLVPVIIPGLPYGSSSLLELLQGSWTVSMMFRDGYDADNMTAICYSREYEQVIHAFVVGNFVLTNYMPYVVDEDPNAGDGFPGFFAQVINSDNGRGDITATNDLATLDTRCSHFTINSHSTLTSTSVFGTLLYPAEAGCPTPAQYGKAMCGPDTQTSYKLWRRSTSFLGLDGESSSSSSSSSSSDDDDDATCPAAPFFSVLDDRVYICYDNVTDIDVNVRFGDGWVYNYHPNRMAYDGECITVTLPSDKGAPVWVQVNGYECHYGENNNGRPQNCGYDFCSPPASPSSSSSSTVDTTTAAAAASASSTSMAYSTTTASAHASTNAAAASSSNTATTSATNPSSTSALPSNPDSSAASATTASTVPTSAAGSGPASSGTSAASNPTNSATTAASGPASSAAATTTTAAAAAAAALSSTTAAHASTTAAAAAASGATTSTVPSPSSASTTAAHATSTTAAASATTAAASASSASTTASPEPTPTSGSDSASDLSPIASGTTSSSDSATMPTTTSSDPSLTSTSDGSSSTTSVPDITDPSTTTDFPVESSASSVIVGVAVAIYAIVILTLM